MQTVAETPTFTKQAEKLFSDDEKAEIVNFLSENSDAGDKIPGTGGIRKLRVPSSGRGKRGGARVIYYFHSDQIPLLALAVYPKNAKTDLTSAEKLILARTVNALIKR